MFASSFDDDPSAEFTQSEGRRDQIVLLIRGLAGNRGRRFARVNSFLAGTLIGSVALELPETGNHRSRSDLIQSDIEISSPSLRS